MNRFKRWNTITGWFSLAIAFGVYLLTLEPSMSLWDCGEFIASAYKLEVGHPPGAPFFLLLSKVFSLATSNPERVAMMINTFSAFVSACTILFLFWTITHLVRKICIRDGRFTVNTIILILGAGFTGAMTYTFSDTFWFSAVEAEVYATSSLFTAVVFWAILKWEDEADEKYANRWIILIAYLMGLSIGVHLLNLLAIPAIVLVFYFKKFNPTVKGSLLALTVSFLILAAMQYGIIPGTVRVAAWFEVFFVNILNLPFNSGLLFYCLTVPVFLFLAIEYTRKKKKIIANTILLALTAILLGYSSYALIIIRANADTPLNENDPKNIFSLLYYLNREQYGSRPLVYGPYYNAPVLSTKTGTPNYIPENNRYIISSYNTEYIYDSRFTTFFPRIYSPDPSHISIYKDWADIKGKPLTVTRDNKQKIEYRPSFTDNMEFFIKYQIGFMYLRYFMWNFAGKQNDIQSNGGIINGNWISGIPVLDNIFYGPQNSLPDHLRNNKGRNRYYLLPLLLGLAGLIYQFRKSKSGFVVITVLFIMTGIAIVVYLNQTPMQPRDRDYAYAGSFYAFAIWIGLGVAGVAAFIQRYISQKYATGIAVSFSLLVVPAVMAHENWDDHNRSGRYIARSVAYNYLNWCAPNAILFTSGDNDTFPLWYLQEVEGIRTDVRVVNLVLLNTDWYIRQMQKKFYSTDPVPMSLKPDKIREGYREIIYFVEKIKDYIDIKDAVAFVASDDTSQKLYTEAGTQLDYLPARNFVLQVDTANILENGTIEPNEVEITEPVLSFRINNSYIRKGDFMVMDILAQNNWKRPIYFTSPSQTGVFGLQRYLRLEGFAWRLTPIPVNNKEYLESGSVNTRVMYDNMMNKFQWGGLDNPDVLIDNHYLRTFTVIRFRLNFARLAKQLVVEGKIDSAVHVLNRYFEITSANTIPPDLFSFKLAEACYLAGLMDKGDSVLIGYAKQCAQEIHYFNALPARTAALATYEKAVSEQTLSRIMDIAKTFNRLDSIRGKEKM